MAMNAKLGRTGSWLCAVLVCAVLAGCGPGRPGVELSFDTPVEARLDALADRGESARLRDLTDFSWDEVHLFHEGASRDDIEEIVGSPVIRDTYHHSSAVLLVFEENGEVVQAVAMTGDYLRGDPLSWRSDVLVKPWGLGYLRLTPPPPKLET